MSDEKVWRGGISNLYDSMEHYGITPSWMKNEAPIVVLPAADYDALQARMAELEKLSAHLDNACENYEARIATLEASLAQKAAECVALNSWVTRLTESTEAAGVERDTALADLATAREECERLRGLLRRVLLALIPDKALASDQQKKLVVESASTILDDVRKELKI